MPPTNFDKFLQKVATDQDFRNLCFTDPAKALGQVGIDPTPENVAALRDAGTHLSKMHESLGHLGKMGPAA